MRPQAERVPELRIRLFDPFRSSGSQPGHIRLHHAKIRMPLQKRTDCPLVLLRRKGAGGVAEISSGTEHIRRRIENFTLPGRAHFHGLRAPIRDGGLLFSEHSLPGTGGVHQNSVKKARKSLLQISGVHIQYQRIGNSHTLDVPGQDLRPLGVDLIGHQQALSLQHIAQLGGLSAGGRAEIQHPLPWLRPQQRRRGHGRGLLQIV